MSSQGAEKRLSFPCDNCGRKGSIDTGGFTPWGQPIEDTCPMCEGLGYFVASGIEASVCLDIAYRQQLGIQKYRKTVADNPLTHKQWLQHAYEEALDFAVYLRRSILELEKQEEAKSCSPEEQ